MKRAEKERESATRRAGCERTRKRARESERERNKQKRSHQRGKIFSPASEEEKDEEEEKDARTRKRKRAREIESSKRTMACFTGPNDPVLMNFVRYHSILLLLLVLLAVVVVADRQANECEDARHERQQKMKKKIKRANGLYLCMD